MNAKTNRLAKTPKTPELVAPAGSWASLRAAVAAGCNSVYFGMKGLNMRHQAENFDTGEMNKIMSYLHEHHVKGYLALNTIIMNKEIKRIKKVLKKAKSCRVDAVILWDMAVFALARKLGLRVHLSTQASVANVQALRYYAKCGVRRIVLARECTFSDIKEMIREVKKRKIRCEIETFIHGAMCVSLSGRCFMSQDTFRKSANRGRCLQPCRREFIIKDADQEAEYILGKDYVLSPKDLCTIEFLDKLIDAGITAFKIEGRMRSAEYVRIVTEAYRRAIDAHRERNLTPLLKVRLKKELATVYNRGFSGGFYFDDPSKDTSRHLQHTKEKRYIGEVTRYFKKIGVGEIKIRNDILRKGDDVLFIGKKTPGLLARIEELQQQHAFVEEAQKGEIVGAKLPFAVCPKDKVFLWKDKAE